MPATMDSSTQTCDEHEFGCNRAEIDTSAPFRSVEEAVIRFGGRGFWIPRNLLTELTSDDGEKVDICKLEDQAAEILNDLNTKQQETLNILKELQLTRKFIEDLKLKLHCNHNALSPAGLVMLELKQAKESLSQRTNELEEIKASVAHVNKKMEKNKVSQQQPQQFVGKNTNSVGISMELRELNYEAEQFMRIAEAAKGEVVKAMCDIEQSKAKLKMIEMRLVSAKKLEEAAKATEELALAEINDLPMSQRKQGRISLSFEEYHSLTQKANRVQSRSMLQNQNVMSHGNVERKANVTSIGDILNRKLVMRDDFDIGRQGKARVSLNQMLDKHRTQTRTEKRNEGGDSKNFFWKKKGFRFVHISVPLSKQSKNIIQSLNLW